MSEDTNGAASEPIEQENTVVETGKGLTIEQMNKAIAEAVGETTRKWQSKFDK